MSQDWISVDQALPKPEFHFGPEDHMDPTVPYYTLSAQVLVVDKDGDFFVCQLEQSIPPGQHSVWSGEVDLPFDEVTHWLPITPPEGKKNV